MVHRRRNVKHAGRAAHVRRHHHRRNPDRGRRELL